MQDTTDVNIDRNLLKYATPSQQDKLQAYWKFGSMRKAAEQLKISHQSLSESIRRVKRQAAKQGYSPDHDMTKEVPEGFTLKGTSTLYDKEGNLKIQWVKTDRTKEDLLEQLSIVTQTLCEDIKGKSNIIPPPDTVDKDLCSVFPIADLHMGMYSWEQETGNSYDCAIAQDLLISSMARLIVSAPNSEQCLLALLGDWFHTDTSENKTMHSGNILDVDTRWQKVFKMGVNVMKTCIEMALAKFKKVKIIICKGNHDDHTSYAISLIMTAYFSGDPRVEIQDSVQEYRYHKFGKNLLGLTHGLIKMDRLPGIMACDAAQWWGETQHRLWLIGHKHSQEVKEYPGVTVEMFRTIAGKDAWTAGMGFRSKRELHRLDLHRERGQIERAIIGIQ